jgi:hypothetical protein
MAKLGSQSYIQNLQYDIKEMKPELSAMGKTPELQEMDNLVLKN